VIDVIKFGNFKNFEKNKNKKQIILCETSRPSEEYLSSLKNRYNGNYKKIPNYLITKEGKVINILTDDLYSNFFYDNETNKNSIIIVIENLGWLKKIPLESHFINWIGDFFNGKPYERKWRDKMYWDNYTEPQFQSLVELSKKLLKKFSINKTFIGHNTKVDGIKIFNGIVCRSNYNNKYTDLNPSFKFDEFKKLIEDEPN
jgi:hypothetical protein